MPYRLKFRRRRENKTDYRKRKVLIISGKLRFSVRRTNKYVIVQIIKANVKGDITLLTVHSSELKKFGWSFSFKNLPACYLTGYLAGIKALNKGIKSAVLDIGLRTPSKGSRVFAVAKGAIDAGMEIPVSEEVLPEDSRIKGEHIVNYYKELEAKGLHETRFSLYSKLNVKEMPEIFEKVKSMIKEKLAHV